VLEQLKVLVLEQNAVVDPFVERPALVALHHVERLDPGIDQRVGVLDVLALLADQRLGLVEVGAQLADAGIALLQLVLEDADAALEFAGVVGFGFGHGVGIFQNFRTASMQEIRALLRFRGGRRGWKPYRLPAPDVSDLVGTVIAGRRRETACQPFPARTRAPTLLLSGNATVSRVRISRVSCAIVGAFFSCARDAGSGDFCLLKAYDKDSSENANALNLYRA